MKLHGLLCLKDEADVVEEHLRHAQRFCDRVFVMDNGSSDESWNIVQEVAREPDSRIVPVGVFLEPFFNGIRCRIHEVATQGLTDEDWLLQLDVDEFIDVDPRPWLDRANAEGFGRIRTWQAQFQFTDVDLRGWQKGEDDRSRPIADRRRYFAVDWREARFWRHAPGREWNDARPDRTIPPWATDTAPFCLVNRHYQYRDPEQITKRLPLRSDNRYFPHSTHEDWKHLVKDHRWLRRWDGVTPIKPRPWRYYLRRVRSRVLRA